MIRPYQPGDASKISTFLTTPQYKRDLQFWVLLNRVLPEQESIIYVAENDGEIIGHYAAIPQTINYRGDKIKAALGLHALVSEDFRNTFTIFKLTKGVYKILENNSFDIIFGFPNQKFKDFQVKVDKWKEIKTIHSFQSKIKQGFKNINKIEKANNSFETYYKISELLDIQHQVENDHVSIRRSVSYYIWRYLHHPQQLYDSYFISNNGVMVGFIVFKIFKTENDIRGHVIDFIKTQDLTNKDIINCAMSYFQGKVDTLSLWPIDDSFEKDLLDYGFSNENGFETFFGYKNINDSFEFNFDNFYLQMGDSDAF